MDINDINDINKYQEFKYSRSYAKLPKISFFAAHRHEEKLVIVEITGFFSIYFKYI